MIFDAIMRRARQRRPDFIIGGNDNPYLFRWWLIPRNKVFNVYVHLFLRSDDDRALHDHPWLNCSIVMKGAYTEHEVLAGGVYQATRLTAGDWRFRWTGRKAHRIELTDGMCWTLFITGPRYREWGFHCKTGWIHWKLFTDTRDKGAIGRGCDQ